MNTKQLSILVALLVLIGGWGLHVYKQNNASWQASDRPAGEKLLGDFPLNDIAQIVITQGTNKLHLEKKDDIWKVRERYDYDANFGEISDFLRKAWELKGVQQVKVGASQLSRLELLDPDKGGTNSATLVEMNDKSSKPVRSLLLGKKHMKQAGGASPMGGMDDSGWPDGRFVMVKNQQSQTPNVWVIAEAFTSIEPKPESWIAKEFVKVEKIKSVSVTSPVATNSWKMSRETESGEMQLADKQPGEELDSSKIYGVGTALSSASFNDIYAPDTKPEAIGLDKPVKAVIETFDSLTYNVEIGKGTNDESFAVRVAVVGEPPKERTPGKDEKKEDKDKLDTEFKDKLEKLNAKLKQEKAFEKWTFNVTKWSVDALLKNRSEFLKPPATKEDANKPAGAPKPAALDAVPGLDLKGLMDDKSAAPEPPAPQ
jgi:hypothetical protein